MRVIIYLAAIFLIAIILETLAYAGIGELFNLAYKKSKLKDPLSLGSKLFTVFGESHKLAKKNKGFFGNP